MVIYNKFGDTVFKRKRRYEKVLYVIYIVIILYIIFGINVNIKLYSSNEEFIEKMLKDSNYYIKYENNNNLVSKIIKNTFNYTKKEKKEVTPVVVNTEVNEPVVYIYNSHQLENYSSNKYEPYNITPNVIMASHILKELLSREGLEAIVEENSIVDYMNLNNYSFGYSYVASRVFLDEKIKTYPSLEFFIESALTQ